MNYLYYGDNLDVLRRHVKEAAVDLVYLDPPFNSNQDYNVLFAEHGTRSTAQIHAFEDTWQWDQGAAAAYEEMVEAGGKVSEVMQAFMTFLGHSDMMAYLCMMAPRLVELRRVLKPTGSIYLHCDPTASHYLKTLMDAVLGAQNFVNEIIWQRTNARSTRGRWPRIHDVLLHYRRESEPTFHPAIAPASRERLPHTLITGPDGQRYQTYELTAPGVTQEGESGKPWRGFDVRRMGRHWANSHSKMEEWDSRGEIHWPARGGFPRRRAREPFVEASRTVTVGDVWTDIDRINQTAKERLGYPTQKPEALLDRIMLASSDEGDVILDPFCGCGTAVAVAQRLNRRWIGIDITHLAIHLIKRRLREAFGPTVEQSYRVLGEPTDLEGAAALAESDPYQFQWWALGLVHARPAEGKKGADKGIDGRLYFHDEKVSAGKTKQIILSVKAGTATAAHVRDLRGVLDREKAAIGVLISLQEPTREMRKEAASAGFYTSPFSKSKHPRLQLLTVADLLEGRGVDYPTLRTEVTFKQAPRAALAPAAEPAPLPFGEQEPAVVVTPRKPRRRK